MGAAVSYVLSYTMWKEWRVEERERDFQRRRKIWLEEHKRLNEIYYMKMEDKKQYNIHIIYYTMGSVLSKFCKYVCCCCPCLNVYEQQRKEIQVIYKEITQTDDCFSAEIEQFV